MDFSYVRKFPQLNSFFFFFFNDRIHKINLILDKFKRYTYVPNFFFFFLVVFCIFDIED